MIVQQLDGVLVRGGKFHIEPRQLFPNDRPDSLMVLDAQYWKTVMLVAHMKRWWSIFDSILPWGGMTADRDEKPTIQEYK